MSDTPELDWVEEGRKHFISSQIHPDKPPLRYPTQDVHSPKDEADYIAGYRSAKAAWDRGERLGGLEAYTLEQDECGTVVIKQVAA